MKKVAIIREGKIPADARVILAPAQALRLQERFPGIQVVVQHSEGRCIPNEAYQAAGLSIVEQVEDCDILLGIKEVPVEQLIGNKTYCFFSHTIKEQPYNRELLQTVLEKNIRLIDYEVLTNEYGQRVIAFGRFAGMVGAHNGLMTYGRRSSTFELPQMHRFSEYQEAKDYYKSLSLPAIKIVITGTGRVGAGAAEVLDDMGIHRVSPEDFLTHDFKQAVYTQLDCNAYVKRKDGGDFLMQDFFDHPEQYESAFEPYTRKADVFINGIYWDNRAPQFFTAEQMAEPDFRIQVIADVTCDIAPEASVPSTLFATTIQDPIFGYNPHTGKAEEPHQGHTIDVMSIDNLPNELPVDASKAFGEQFLAHVADALIGKGDTAIIERATIAQNGQLGPHFQYLQNYVDGK